MTWGETASVNVNMKEETKQESSCFALTSIDLLGFPPVLDVCCGSRMFWFDRNDERAFFVDKRQETHELSNGSTLEISPDKIADFTSLPFPDETFALVVFDPPHIERLEMRGDVTKKYGVLFPDWRETLCAGFEECFRVLRDDGVLIFKWCEVEIPLREVLKLTPEKPLLGHQTGKKPKRIGSLS